jgi:serine/threonine-protein kinase HipA
MGSDTSELVVLLAGREAGRVERSKGGTLALHYSDEWRQDAESYPLSLSMPLALASHDGDVVRSFLEGLLPDDRDVLEQWGKRFQVSPRNPFALLAHMGHDCAGAVQFVQPDRVDEVRDNAGTIEWLSEGDIGQRLRDLIENHGTGRLERDEGQFSLAGAQPKTALFHDGEKWGIPSGSIATTHIVKPPALRGFSGIDVNEHFCLLLAAELGIPATESRARSFDGQPALVLTRYDRRWSADGRVARVHQEDACQALAIPPWRKYENEGGPGLPDLVGLLERESDSPGTDVATLLDSVVFNWVIAGTDAHAKNYSLLLGPGSVRLAPLYDLLSGLPYPQRIPYRKAKLAMRIDREYLIWKIRSRHWDGFAARCDLDPGPVVERVYEVVRAIPDAVRIVGEHARAEGLPDDLVRPLETAIAKHGKHCLTVLGY